MAICSYNVCQYIPLPTLPRDRRGVILFSRNTAFLAAAAAAASFPAPLLAGPVIAPGWGYPVFQDNFDGGSINQGVWQVANWVGANNNESQYYHPGQVSVSGGALHLRADRDPNCLALISLGLTEALGSEISAAFVKLKRAEWASYAASFSPWERDTTLDI